MSAERGNKDSNVVFLAIPWSLGAFPKVVGAIRRACRAIPWVLGAIPWGLGAISQALEAIPWAFGAILVLGTIPRSLGTSPPSMLSFGLTSKDPTIETNKPDLYLECGG